jgi:hypothetical protein
VVNGILWWSGRDDCDDDFALFMENEHNDGWLTFCTEDRLYAVASMNQYKESPFAYLQEKWVANEVQAVAMFSTAGWKRVDEERNMLFLQYDTRLNIGDALSMLFNTNKLPINTWYDPWDPDRMREQGLERRVNDKYFYDQGLFYYEYVELVSYPSKQNKFINVNAQCNNKEKKIKL